MVKMSFNLFIDSSLIADSYSTSGIKEYSGFDDIQPLRLILLHKMKYLRDIQCCFTVGPASEIVDQCTVRIGLLSCFFWEIP